MSSTPPERDVNEARNIRISVAMFAITFVCVTFIGAQTHGVAWNEFARYPLGFSYSVPLMSILLSHELGHYIAARIHRVPASPPFFIPMPIQPLGTMGAVILMRDRIARRNALLDIGAAGPLAGLFVAIPVLVYGIMQSPVGTISPEAHMQEGHSLLYVGLLRLLKGPIADGHDILLSPTAFAGWAGLLVTMLNLIPAVQLDGGHIAYALFGERQQHYSRMVRRMMLPLAAAVSLFYGVSAFIDGYRGWDLVTGFAPGIQWGMWWLVLRFMANRSEHEHPPTDDGELSPVRRIVAGLTLALFVLLFMPAWLRDIPALPH